MFAIFDLILAKGEKYTHFLRVTVTLFFIALLMTELIYEWHQKA
jgi:hypothetical protein